MKELVWSDISTGRQIQLTVFNGMKRIKYLSISCSHEARYEMLGTFNLFFQFNQRKKYTSIKTEILKHFKNNYSTVTINFQ